MTDIIVNLILSHMDLSPHNIQRIKKWIQSEAEYKFRNKGYTICNQDDQVLLEQNDIELKQVCPHCLLVPISIVFQMRTPYMSSMFQRISKTYSYV